MVAQWPKTDPSWADANAEEEFDALMEVVVAARKLRADQHVPPGQRVSVRVATADSRLQQLAEDGREAVLLLARGSDIAVSGNLGARPAVAELVHCFGEPCAVWIERQVSREEILAQAKRVQRDLERLRQEDARLASKLESAEFQKKAPAEVKRKATERRQAALERIAALEVQLADLAKLRNST